MEKIDDYFTPRAEEYEDIKEYVKCLGQDKMLLRSY